MAASESQSQLAILWNGWMGRIRTRSLPLVLVVSLLLAVALGLRLYGVDWDQGFLFHPDERAIYMKVWDLDFPANDLGILLNADQSPWNPRWFPYGSYPLYQLKGFQYLLSPFLEFEFGDLRLVGRALSALADTATVLVVLLLGARIFGFRAGLLGAILVAFSVIHIQLSHFYTVETFFTLFIALSLLFLLRVLERGRLRDSALAGVFVGLALATKVSAVPVLAAVGVAYLMSAFSAEGWRLVIQMPSRRRLLRIGLAGTVTLGVAGLAFLVAAPFAILDWDTFLGDVVYQGQMVVRELDLPYTRQYENTVQHWYQLRQLSTWGLGLPLGLVALGGLLFALATLWRGRHKGVLLLLAWVLPYLLITGSFEVKFLRYLLPVIPFLVLLGAHLLVSGTDFAATRRFRWRTLAQGVTLFILAATAFYAFAHLNVYTQPHTAVRASQWIQQNVPPGSLLLTEHWEEGFPGLHEYRSRSLPMYEADTFQKLDELVGALAAGDYVLFYSNRLYGTIPRLPERYPLSTRYYQALFAGELGYQLVHWEATYPQLLGVAFVDDTFTRPDLPVPQPLEQYRAAPVSLDLGYADENFTVYDHPKVLIFQNEGKLSEARLRTILTSPIEGDRVSVQGEATPLGLMLTSSELQAQQEGGAWTDIIHPEGWGSRFVPWSWLLLLAAITVAGLPLALLLFQSLPDKGYLFAKPLGILVVAYVVWLLASLKVASFSAPTIYLTMLGVGGVSLGLAYFQRQRLLATVKEHWRLWLVAEAVFLVAFFAFLLIRMANPDLWHPWRGGEKFQEMAYLTAVAKSTFMPPYDPWFAGGSLNYYYFGYFIVAIFIKALGVAPAVAFNLAIPLLFGLMVGGAFSLVYNLAALSPHKRGLGGLMWPALGAGLTGGLFVAVLGNLDGMAQALQNLWRAAQSQGLIPFDYWRSSRMMPPDPPGFEVTEFPFWSYLFADLHPHMMVIPFALLALGVALTALLEFQRSSWRIVPVAGALALALGVLWPLNTWDYPTYAAIGVAALVLGVLVRGGVSRGSLAVGLALAGMTLVVSYLLFLPFHLRFQGFSSLVLSETQTVLWQYLGIHGLFVFVVGTYLVKEAAPGLFRLGNRLKATPLSGPLPLAEGGSFPSALGDALAGAGELPGSVVPPPAGAPSGGQASAALVPRSFRSGWLAFALVTGVLALVAGLAIAGYLVAGVLLVGLGIVLHLLWRALASQGEGFVSKVLERSTSEGVGSPTPSPRFIGTQAQLRKTVPDVGAGHALPATLFALLLLGMGLAIGIGVELVTVKPDVDRFNTVFKFYEQAWVLLALASAFLLWRLRWGLALSPALRQVPRGVWMGVLGLLLISTLIFPVLGTRARLADRFQVLPLTVNGMAYMGEAVYHDPRGGSLELRWDLEPVQWLQENVRGSPVVLEGGTDWHGWGNRISVYTGLPAIVGPDWPQIQQRGVYSGEVQRRRAVVNQLYTTTNVALTLRLLEEHQVEYIVVGELERLYYPRAGLAKFEAMVGDSLERVYQSSSGDSGVTIYRVQG